ATLDALNDGPAAYIAGAARAAIPSNLARRVEGGYALERRCSLRAGRPTTRSNERDPPGRGRRRGPIDRSRGSIRTVLMKTRVVTLIASALLLFGGTADAQSIRSDFADFSAGKFLRYSTKGHPKAGPVDLAIKYPLGWKRDEGEKPHVVQKMTRTIGLV